MLTTEKLYEALYVSTIAPGVPITSVGTIASKSRIANQTRGITGVLIFDGMRYCQQLEGPREEVLALLERIRQDSRHSRMEVLHQGAIASRRFQSFGMGYTTADDVELLERFEKMDGQEALEAFLALAAQVDFV